MKLKGMGMFLAPEIGFEHIIIYFKLIEFISTSNTPIIF